MKTLVLAAIRCSPMFTGVTASLFSIRPAQAYTVTLHQVGSNVVATGSGAINLTDLTFGSSTGETSVIIPSLGVVFTGPTNLSNTFLYIGEFSGPTSFGAGGQSFANSGSGDFVGFIALEVLLVPSEYVSGAALSDTSTYSGATFASLGVTPGTYVWTWGTGLPNQNFTLIIGGGSVPDGGSTVSLLGCALLGLAALRRKLSC
jgi:VPDSG-CTERM motif